MNLTKSLILDILEVAPTMRADDILTLCSAIRDADVEERKKIVEAKVCAPSIVLRPKVLDEDGKIKLGILPREITSPLNQSLKRLSPSKKEGIVSMLIPVIRASYPSRVNSIDSGIIANSWAVILPLLFNVLNEGDK